jgi:hypothetical protein
MASRSLKYRRLRARGLNARLARLWGNRYFRGIGNRATRTLLAGNSSLTYIARTPGTGGNAITIAYVVAGNNTPLSVTVAGNAITVNVATGAGGAATSTANDVARAVNFSATAGPLVWAENAAASDGTGVVSAVAATALTGGT